MNENLSTIVEIENVTKRYGRTLALDEVSLEVRENELFALLGPNGAGKTTLVHILCTIHPPDRGTVRVAGIDVAKQPFRARQKIGVVFQESSLDTRLTVSENLDFHGMIYGVPRALRRKRIDETLELVELTKWREHLVSSLSTGMRRRLEIARALVHDSRILFLDEPTVGLDAQTRGRTWEYVRTLQSERNLTVLVTTHYIEEVETCDRICIIDHGKVLALDTPAALKANYGQDLLRVQLDSKTVESEVIARYEKRLVGLDGEFILIAGGKSVVEEFLKGYGTHVRALEVVTPSLETVFLSVTGREVRDRAAGAREQTYEFGKRGGEHTR